MATSQNEINTPEIQSLNNEVEVENMENDFQNEELSEGNSGGIAKYLAAGSLGLVLLSALACGGYNFRSEIADAVSDKTSAAVPPKGSTPEEIKSIANSDVGRILAESEKLDPRTATALACSTLDKEAQKLCIAMMRSEKGFVVATGKSKITLDNLNGGEVIYADNESEINTSKLQIQALEKKLEELEKQYAESKQDKKQNKSDKKLKSLESQIRKLRRTVVSQKRRSASNFTINGSFTGNGTLK